MTPKRDFESFCLEVEEKQLEPCATLKVALSKFEEGLPKKAIDFGCCDGVDTFELLKNGFHVTAIDSDSKIIENLNSCLGKEYPEKLIAVVSDLETAEFSSSAIINAHAALPYLAPADFHRVWQKLSASLILGGLFSGYFLGKADCHAKSKFMTSLSQEALETLFIDYDIVHFRETQGFGICMSSVPKFSHIFHVVARKKRLT